MHVLSSCCLPHPQLHCHCAAYFYLIVIHLSKDKKNSEILIKRIWRRSKALQAPFLLQALGALECFFCVSQVNLEMCSHGKQSKHKSFGEMACGIVRDAMICGYCSLPVPFLSADACVPSSWNGFLLLGVKSFKTVFTSVRPSPTTLKCCKLL